MPFLSACIRRIIVAAALQIYEPFHSFTPGYNNHPCQNNIAVLFYSIVFVFNERVDRNNKDLLIDHKYAQG